MRFEFQRLNVYGHASSFSFSFRHLHSSSTSRCYHFPLSFSRIHTFIPIAIRLCSPQVLSGTPSHFTGHLSHVLPLVLFCRSPPTSIPMCLLRSCLSIYAALLLRLCHLVIDDSLFRSSLLVADHDS